MAPKKKKKRKRGRPRKVKPISWVSKEARARKKIIRKVIKEANERNMGGVVRSKPGIHQTPEMDKYQKAKEEVLEGKGHPFHEEYLRGFQDGKDALKREYDERVEELHDQFVERDEDELKGKLLVAFVRMLTQIFN